MKQILPLLYMFYPGVCPITKRLSLNDIQNSTLQSSEEIKKTMNLWAINPKNVSFMGCLTMFGHQNSEDF